MPQVHCVIHIVCTREQCEGFLSSCRQHQFYLQQIQRNVSQCFKWISSCDCHIDCKLLSFGVTAVGPLTLQQGGHVMVMEQVHG